MMDPYKEEVIEPGDAASKLAKEICFRGHENCGAIEIIPRQPGNFRGAVDFRWKRHVLEEMLRGKMAESPQNDGAGGKPQFHAFLSSQFTYYQLIWEIICMIADDVARAGGFAAVMDNDINAKQVTKENFHLVEALFEGMENALAVAGLVNITGEFAIMKHSVTAFCDINDPRQLIMNWSGSCIGLTHEDKKIDNSTIREKMPIVGFWDPGYRCNGGTFFTNLILAVFGKDVRKSINDSRAIEFVRKLTVPSLSYARMIQRAHGWNDDGSTKDAIVKMAGIAHITGGGVWGKFGEILPDGIGADLYNMPIPAQVLLEAQEMSWDIPKLRLTDLQAYGTLHGGCGMLVVCDSLDDAANLERFANTEGSGIKASLVGYTTLSSTNEVVIKSRFKEGRILSSNELKK